MTKLRTEKDKVIKGLNVLIEELKQKEIYTKFLLEKREKEMENHTKNNASVSFSFIFPILVQQFDEFNLKFENTRFI